MPIADVLGKVGKGLEAGAKVAGAVAAPIGKALIEEEAGYAPKIAEEKRQREYSLEDQQINAKAQELESQLAMGRQYGTLTPEQQSQYVDSISQLYSHPRHAGLLMEKLRKAIHPEGATRTPASAMQPLANATPVGGTAAQDEAAREKAMAESAGVRQKAVDEEIDRRAKFENERIQAQSEYRDADLELRQKALDLNEAKFKAQQDPNSPQAKLNVKKAEAELENSRARMMQAQTTNKKYQATTWGTVDNQVVPGSIQTETGQVVGSTNAPNIRPTGTERVRADLATSTLEQIDDVNSIISKRPDLFGPAAGRGTDFTVWLGSQDPDAQRMKAAIGTISSHLSGVYGARGKYSQEDISKVIGQFRTNPQALAAALDQYGKAAKTIQSKGVIHAVGGINQLPVKAVTNPPGGVSRILKPAGGGAGTTPVAGDEDIDAIVKALKGAK